MNTNNNNNNNNNTFPSETIEQKRPSRSTISNLEDDFGQCDHRRTKMKSLLPLSNGETSAFQLVHPSSHSFHSKSVHKEQQQQYIALLKILKSQEIEVEQQKKELYIKQKGFIND